MGVVSGIYRKGIWEFGSLYLANYDKLKSDIYFLPSIPLFVSQDNVIPVFIYMCDI